jgi:hypothetical protein
VTYKVVFGRSYVRLVGARKDGPGRISTEGAPGIKFVVGNLDDSELGEHPVLVVLTYPGRDELGEDTWRKYVPNDRVLNSHIDEFLGEWERKWGLVQGVMIKEFQRRGAPHVNWFARWPDAAGGYEEARVASVRAGRKSGHRYLPLGEQVVPAKGELGYWARTAWAVVVTGNDGSKVARAHHVNGVNFRVWSFSERAYEFRDPFMVLWYLARDVGKESQKTAPKGFGPVKPWWRAYGMTVSDPVVEEVEYAVFQKLKGRLQNWQVAHGQKVSEHDRPWKGTTAWGLGAEEGVRMLMEVEAEFDAEFAVNLARIDDPF